MTQLKPQWKALLKSYIEQPLISPARIIERLDAVEQLYKISCYAGNRSFRKVYDLERLMTRVMYRTATQEI